MKHQQLMGLACLSAAVLGAGRAAAEGSAQVGANQRIQNTTALRADILNAATETITWTGTGTLQVRDPSNALVATLSNNQTYDPTVNGVFALTMSASQTGAWNITVNNAAAGMGRIWSTRWMFNTGSFAAAAASNGSFFALVPGGNPSKSGVVELKLAGLSGNVYEIAANQTGVNGPNAGQSVPQASNSYTPLYQLYLSPPQASTYDPLVPEITNFNFGGGDLGCGLVSPGAVAGSFNFDSNIQGTFHLVCDVNNDDVFDRVDPGDFLAVGTTTVGTNAVAWDGTDNSGAPVASGSYECKVFLNVGEMHYVGQDMETAYQGLRMFQVNLNLSRTSLPMFWNDTVVQGNEVNMLNGQPGLATSGANGMSSGSFAAAASANVNARAWGNFTANSKGNNALLDTYTYLQTDASLEISVTVVDGAVDSDNDGLGDAEETCNLGTNPALPDTDGDGIEDGDEANGGAPDTDGDGLIDALDPDSDNDGVDDGVDTSPLNPNVCRDSDSDQCDDCINTGNDESGGNPANDGLNSDADGLCNFGDPDDDNDGVADATDTAPLNANVCADADADTCDDCAVTGANGSGGNPANDGLNSDADGLCNLGDPDDDNDGVADATDTAPLNANVCADADADTCDDCAVTGANGSGGNPANDGTNSDVDGICDLSDSDDDNDGVADATDTAPLNANVCADADADTCDDCAVTGANGSSGSPANDGLNSDADGLCNLGDPDDDNDGVADATDAAPLNANVCADADADTCDDCAVTGANGSAGSPANDGLNSDTDGLCDVGDPDDDNDGVGDATDTAPLNANVCADVDADTCDDCAVTGANGSGGSPANDGLNSDADGLCNLGDPDDDNDGVTDITDTSPFNANVCADADADTCDDCAVTGANGSGGSPANDGANSDLDGICDLSDPDDDNDGVGDATDPAPLDATACADSDADGCSDCAVTGANGSSGDPANDGPDSDDDGTCDLGESDMDGDGVRDPFDADVDGDGIPDATEGAGDLDGDGIPNARDLDSDGDSIPDTVEYGLGALDDDGDGTLDDSADQDGDGLPDVNDAAPADAEQVVALSVDIDTDADGFADRIDLDSDADGLSDLLESGSADPTGSGLASGDDLDDNGWIDGYESVTLAELPDTDGDDSPDFRDTDSDADGLSDAVEAYAGQDGVGALGTDGDGDGLDDAFDPDAEGTGGSVSDTDADGLPNPFDRDDDGDGLLSAREDVNNDGSVSDDDTDGDGIPNYLDADDDGDGIDTASEGADPNADGVPSDALHSLDAAVPDYLNESQTPTDSDGDGIPDLIECPLVEPAPDSDGDGLVDCQDSDDDGDGFPTTTENQPPRQDSDGDGNPDYLDADDDGDGVVTADEGNVDDDTDADGTPDYLDPDDDGDGLPTMGENESDVDGDGNPDYLDAEDDRNIPVRLEGGGVSCSASGSSQAGLWPSALVMAMFGVSVWRRRRGAQAPRRPSPWPLGAREKGR